MSRGLLVKRLLEQESFDPPQWLEIIRASECAAFNLVFADTRAPRAFVYCSDTDGVAEISLAVPFTLANGCPGAHWPREQRLLELFSSSEQGSSSSSRFMDLLRYQGSRGLHNNSNLATFPFVATVVRTQLIPSTTPASLSESHQLERELSMAHCGELFLRQ